MAPLNIMCATSRSSNGSTLKTRRFSIRIYLGGGSEHHRAGQQWLTTRLIVPEMVAPHRRLPPPPARAGDQHLVTSSPTTPRRPRAKFTLSLADFDTRPAGYRFTEQRIDPGG